jgi:hypothetical protein
VSVRVLAVTRPQSFFSILTLDVRILSRIIGGKNCAAEAKREVAESTIPGQRHCGAWHRNLPFVH